MIYRETVVLTINHKYKHATKKPILFNFFYLFFLLKLFKFGQFKVDFYGYYGYFLKGVLPKGSRKKSSSFCGPATKTRGGKVPATKEKRTFFM